MVTIKYALSTKGQKASLLAGGSGERVQTISLKHGEPEYAATVAMAQVDGSGKATLDLHSCPQVTGDWRVREYDSPPAVSQLLAHESERQSFLAARAAEHELEVLAELLAAVPGSLLRESSQYGWGLKPEAEKRVEALGKGVVEKAKAEADRRNAEKQAQQEQWKAAQAAEKARKEKEKEESAERLAAEIWAWADKHGSDRLNRCVAEHIECGAIYRSERLALEYPGWERDTSDLPSWDEPRNPPAEALELLDKARASLPADWTAKERESAELKYWSKEDDAGYAVTVDPGDWTSDTLVYGYDGPRG